MDGAGQTTALAGARRRSASDLSCRPGVSVVVPFAGGSAEAAELREGLAGLELGPADEVIVVNNSPGGAADEAWGPATVVDAARERSSYYARNVGAERARAEWLLFMDGDCHPSPTLLDDYFAEPLAEDCGLVVGEVAPADPRGLIGAYAVSRSHLTQAGHVGCAYRPFGATGNLLVRRRAWAQVGGFLEGVVSAADADFSWRLLEAGWTLTYRPSATVDHRHHETLDGLLRQGARYGAGNAWRNRRWPGSFPRPRLGRPLARCAAGLIVWTLVGQPRRAVFKGLDGAWHGAMFVGWLRGNRAKREGPPRDGEIVIMTDQFPPLSETFVANEARALQKLGCHVRVEASARPARPDRSAAREVAAIFLEDDGLARRLADLLWLVSRHPLGCWRDWRAQRRWRQEEEVFPLRSLASSARRLRRGGERHIHAHFASAAALNALRLHRLLGVPWSITAHAYDIYKHPRNLIEKLEGAAFVTSGCRYTVEHLRSLVSPGRADRVHEIVMGIDGERFRRRSAHPAGRFVLAVGRLVEKKGFADLIDAMALLATQVPVDRLLIVGDGPLRDELQARIARHGLSDVVELAGWRDPDDVREALEHADLLAMPCVVATDGDRDSMPVVVKEALAMEVPVVATDAVGLPEVVRAEWGRLVAPRDSVGLASAIAELLALSPQRRAAMGAAGRRFVLSNCDVRQEAAKLARLIASAAS